MLESCFAANPTESDRLGLAKQFGYMGYRIDSITYCSCGYPQTSVFSECICEGLSPEQDEIFLEVLPEEILYCLRGVSSGVSTSGTVGVLSSQSHTTVGSSGVTLPRGQTTLTNFVSTARSLKIKLVRRKTPCLALEVEQVKCSNFSL